jgi:pimeloyl-ACP methyl ester carboxylesterase
MPPGLLSHLEWYGTAPHAADFLRPLAECRTVILYDRHGCGLSDRDRTDFSAEDDIQAVAHAAGGGPFDLLGISWGALPVVTFAARHPERVRRLVLYGATVSLDLSTSTQFERQVALAALRRADLPVVLQEQLEAIDFGVQRLVGDITAPTLVLHRRGDQMASFANAEYYARHIRGARFIPLEGDAHFPWSGDWRSVVTPILDFLLASGTAA